MDIPALQARLRQFAAERNWTPYQTPKNLAMAMIVEAAELVEHFQWMTPEQSQRSGQDPDLQGRIGDEIADVLIYLVQIADHTGVDIDRAVENKIGKNAVKYPAP
ncbi:MAG: nucleotide pyrophosphohydrolase [Thiomonas sp.]|nr:nucleotide pyrophosphohydrolase [Thiomonas sp.]